jgi:hypothetical protein
MKHFYSHGFKTEVKKLFLKTLRVRVILQLALMMMAGCLTPIDQISDYEGGQVVISGQISTLPEMNLVTVSITSSLIRLPEPVYDANVTLVDENGNQTAYRNRGDGKYALDNFFPVPGKAYHIRVVIPDGRTFESTPETMPVALGHDDVYYTFENELYTDKDGVVADRTFLKIYTNHTLSSSEEPLYIKWDVEEVYILSPTDFPDVFGNVPPPCFIAQRVEPQKMILFSNEAVKVTDIQDFELVSRLVDRSFKERHYFTTYQSSLTPEAYEYWRKVDVVANQVGSIFDPPPARVKGNIINVDDTEEEVHGYFQAVNQTFDRFYLVSDDLPFKIPLYCEYRDTRYYYDYPPECLNCRIVPNSSHNRPSWF